jgi:hypothetical protein
LLSVEVGALAAARGAAERALETGSRSFPREFRKSHFESILGQKDSVSACREAIDIPYT